MKSNNTNILITGANGFIGSHLAEFFTKKNLMYFHLIDTIYKIILDGLKNSPNKNKIKFILGDIRDYDSVYKAMKGCKSVIHLAALIGIPYFLCFTLSLC